jgi:hypothetical protein
VPFSPITSSMASSKTRKAAFGMGRSSGIASPP